MVLLHQCRFNNKQASLTLVDAVVISAFVDIVTFERHLRLAERSLQETKRHYQGWTRCARCV